MTVPSTHQLTRENSRRLLVKKYGGSSLAHPEQILRVADHIAELTRAGHLVLVVVSAMGKTTDQLIALAHQVSQFPSRRELDMLLSTGERISMALMSMALGDRGVRSISFTGSQAGVLTDGAHSNARILELKPLRVAEELSKGNVVVLAGFQGVDPSTKEITTLGRGGTDTTAVAMAGHFHAARCEILKDVDGVYSADPKMVSHPKRYENLSYAELGEMCFWGAKVLHYRSVELARSLKVPLFVGSAERPTIGSLIQEDSMFENGRVLGINSHKEVIEFVIQCEQLDLAYKDLERCLSEHALAWPQILAAEVQSKTCRIWATAPIESLDALEKAVSLSATKSKLPIQVRSRQHASVTATCAGSVSSNVANKMLQSLASANVSPTTIISSPMSITFILDKKSLTPATESLHKWVE